jgi:outer membrane protein assembly factor BamD (BamD/ComL family)
LSDEVATLQVARIALADRDANAALAALDRYKSRFATGRLGPEATVLRIEALMLRGDRAQASALADRFESSNPKSPYAERIRSIVRQAGGAAREPVSR